MGETVCVTDMDGDVEEDLDGRCVEVVVTDTIGVLVDRIVGGGVRLSGAVFVGRGEDVPVLLTVVVRVAVSDS